MIGMQSRSLHSHNRIHLKPLLSYLQGHIDAPFINLTPGTRSGIIRDEAYAALLAALVPLQENLIEMIEAQRRAEEEQASRELLQTIQRAFRDALLALPAEEYDWFDIHARTQRASGTNREFGSGDELSGEDILPGFRCPLASLFPALDSANAAAATPAATVP